MEPRIQYAKTEDGVNIAYWAAGEGLPVVNMPGAPSSHIELEWNDPDFGEWYRRHMRTHRVIRYDPRGTGLSDRDVSSMSLEAWVRDLEAVVDALGLERFALTGIVFSGPVAIAYAARNPEKVSQLFLWCTYAGASNVRTPQFDLLQDLATTDWNLYTETTAHAMVAGWAEGDRARRFAAMFREGISPEALITIRNQWADVDVSDLLPRITVPTLVIHRREVVWPELKAAKDLAAAIPGARLQVLEGSSLLPFVGDMEAVVRSIDEALGLESPEGERGRTAEQGRHLVIILMTDMESSTALTEQLGDAGAQEVRRVHNDIVRAALTANGGLEIKHTGDGIMASFSTASSALNSATAIQRGVADHLAAHPESPLAVYVGLNAGEPIAEEGDLFGTSINLAARICDHARPGQILASDVVRQLAAGKQFLFSDLGETELRGFEDPVKLWEVRWQGDA